MDTPTNAQWEYMVLNVDHQRAEKVRIAGESASRVPQNERILNALGAEGWELVSAVAWACGELWLKRRRTT